MKKHEEYVRQDK